MADNFIVATLGPAGTCSEAVLRDNIHRFGEGAIIELYTTYESVITSVSKGISKYGLVAAAYPKLHNLIFESLGKVTISDCFLFNTSELVFATGTASELKQIACVEAIIPLLTMLALKNVVVVPANSNADAARMVAGNLADACITTSQAAESWGFFKAHSFGKVPMGWMIFKNAQ